jgi:exonuclease III
MAKAFSIASWNVEHFKGDPARVQRVVKFLKDQNPDVFALYEVEGATVFQSLVTLMPGYTFHITEGPQVQEILLGVRSNLTAFFTQKVEFKDGSSALRPGALLTITIGSENYPVLFLHTKSGNDPKGLGLRDDMLVRAVDFRKVLDKAPPSKGKANYIFMGDLNTMGMIYHYVSGKNLTTDNELTKLSQQAKRRKMRLLTKDHPETWSNGPGSSIADSNLDHVVAADHLQFRDFGGAEVSVRGWPAEDTPAKQGNWIKNYSDHALMYMEVLK